MKGVYVHIPFCAQKCPYCDFYSIKGNAQIRRSYFDALIKEIKERKCAMSDTLYIGGGTPSLADVKTVKAVIDTVRKECGLAKDAEITLEANPSDLDKDKAAGLKDAGVNRISLGVESALSDELRFLGRNHRRKDVETAVRNLKDAGIKNISVDLMFGLCGQTVADLYRSIEFVKELGVLHLSAYILKIEKGTQFFKTRPNLPNDDQIAKLYLSAVKRLEQIGFKQYEISNFAKEGFESAHNLKYWRQEQYMGYGVSAHSFEGNKRYAHSRNILEYIKKGKDDLKETDGGGDSEEWLILRTRLNRGVSANELKERGFDVKTIFKKAELLKKRGLVKENKGRICLTPEGMLLQNSVVLYLL